jgi:maltose alpha-D-glucosyltransferase/alpha-amylase
MNALHDACFLYYKGMSNVKTAMAKKYWWKEAKIYELYVDKFAGDFKSLTKELGYFEALGVNCLHILPHYPSPLIDDGYDVSDYRGVRPELGTIEDFEKMTKEAHIRGIRIIVDFVVNHTSSEHPWFIEARKDKNAKTRDYYLWSETATEFKDARSYFPDIKKGNWIFNPQTEDYYFATFYPEQPDLNWDNPAVFADMMATVDFWIAKGADGFRIDAAPYLVKRDGTSCRGLPETHALIKRIRAHIDAIDPNVILIAEAHQKLADTKSYFGAGDECHMMYHFGLMEEMWVSLLKGDTARLEKMVADSRDIPENCQWAIFLRNHDEISISTLEEEMQTELLALFDPEKAYTMEKMKRTAMRIGSVFKGDREKILKALQLLYTSPGAPIMYYGDEIGMNNLELQEGVIDTRRYVRGAFDRKAAQAQMDDPESLFNAVASILKKKPAEIVHAEESVPEEGT